MDELICRIKNAGALMSFQFCLISTDVNSDIISLNASKSGGLENDGLQIQAKAHFSSDAAGGKVDDQARIDALGKSLAEQGKDISQFDPAMLSKLSSIGGSSVEICSLDLPTKANGFVGVSLYCDAYGSAKKCPPNKRATDIARACGYDNLVVFGDAFLSRYYDNEEDNWVRMDLTTEEASPKATWVKKCALRNKGKNMNAYSTSGATSQSMQNMLGMKGGNTAAPATAAPTPLKKAGIVSWTQSRDEVEARIKVPLSTSAKNVTVSISTDRLHVSLKNGLEFMTPEGEGPFPDDAICTSAATLYSKVDSSESTWTLDKDGSQCEVVLSLVKSPEINWLSFCAE